MNDAALIEEFLAGSPFAVVGASRDRQKYGNRVLRAYLQAGRDVCPVNPHADTVEGLTCYPDLQSLPGTPHGISIITPPAVTDLVIPAAAKLGIKHVWIQPGAESVSAIEKANDLGIQVIHSGPCVLVVLGYRASM